jgi:RNA polymerase sigma-70 factor (ECF subfamily)
MTEQDLLAEQFEANRRHLRAVAHRMLGSATDAEDAVQESWLRLSRAAPRQVGNLGGWLTTVVARVCVDMLRSRTSRREEPLGQVGQLLPEPAGAPDPSGEVEVADSVGLALVVVLEHLAPAERLAFVLHDVFDVPFDLIAPILGRTPTAVRQLACRARRRLQGAEPSTIVPGRQRAIVDAFLTASRGGRFEELIALLDPEAARRADPLAVQNVRPGEFQATAGVPENFFRRAMNGRRTVFDGAPGTGWAAQARVRVLYGFTIIAGKILEVTLWGYPEQLRKLNMVVLPDQNP